MPLFNGNILQIHALLIAASIDDAVHHAGMENAPPCENISGGNTDYNDWYATVSLCATTRAQ